MLCHDGLANRGSEVSGDFDDELFQPLNRNVKLLFYVFIIVLGLACHIGFGYYIAHLSLSSPSIMEIFCRLLMIMSVWPTGCRLYVQGLLSPSVDACRAVGFLARGLGSDVIFPLSQIGVLFLGLLGKLLSALTGFRSSVLMESAWLHWVHRQTVFTGLWLIYVDKCWLAFFYCSVIAVCVKNNAKLLKDVWDMSTLMIYEIKWYGLFTFSELNEWWHLCFAVITYF